MKVLPTKQLLLGALMAVAGTNCVLAENVILTAPSEFKVLQMSPNGKWACGVFVNSYSEPKAFRWNLETDEVEMLGDNNESIAWGIADDGTVSGNFAAAGILPHGRTIAVPAYNRPGQGWQAVEIPEGMEFEDAVGYGISPDGRSMTGVLVQGGKYVPYIWRDGKLYKKIECPTHATAYTISPDGEAVAGWSYGAKGNRVATYWKPDGTQVQLLDAPIMAETMFAACHNFSPDGSKLVYWGGWNPNAEKTENALYGLYEVATDKRIQIPALSYGSTMEFFNMTDDGMLVGDEQGRGFIYDKGELLYIDDYLKKINVDLSDFAGFYRESDSSYGANLPISRVQDVSADGKTFIFHYFDTKGNESSMCLKTDVDVTCVAPGGLTARSLVGANAVELKWKAPLGMKSVRGYNIYRDGKKLNILPQTKTSYVDTKLADGTYTYKVSTVNLSNQEKEAEAVEVKVEKPATAAPYNLFVRQKGVNSAYLEWQKPESSLIHKRYFSPDGKPYASMSVYAAVEMEAAVKFSKDEISAYKGASIREVSFVPGAEQNAWKVVIYTYDADNKLKELASIPVTQQLDYKKLNTVTLPEPVAVPDGDLVVAIQVDVMNGSEEVLGTQDGECTAGYSDLLRQITDEDFMSAYASSVDAGYEVTSFNWVIDLGLALSGNDEVMELSHYNLYTDGQKNGEINTTSTLVTDLTDGTHTLGVEAVYKSGEVSAKTEQTVSIVSAYAKVGEPDVNVKVGDGTATVSAKWTAPVNNDRKRVSFAMSEAASRGVAGVEGSLIIGAEYRDEMLRGYNGYKIDNVRFWPMCEGIFTVGIYCNGEVVFEKEVEELTLNEWNSVSVDKDLILDETAIYRVVVDVFDAEPGKEVFGVDNFNAYVMRSDLFSSDAGENWASLFTESGLNRSWLLSMDLITEPEALQPEGYDVVVDNKVVNSTKVTDNEYSFDMKADKYSHRLAIHTYYPAKTEAVEGQGVMFKLENSGISENVITSVTLRPGRNVLVAEGDGVESISLVSTAGVEVAATSGNSLNISSLSDGIYIATVKAASGNFTRKIQIKH